MSAEAMCESTMPSGGERQQPEGPLGGLRQGLVDEPEAAAERAAGAGGHVVQLLGHVGDGGLGVRGEPAADQRQRGGLAPALLGEGLGGAGVDGDPGVPDALGEHLDPGGGVQPAEGAGADIRNAGEGPFGGDDDEAFGGVRQQGVDLVRVGGVVDEEDHPPPGECGAQGGAELVLGGAGGVASPSPSSRVRIARSVATVSPPGAVRRTLITPSG